MNYRFWFYTLNAALLIGFAIAFGQDYNAEWKHYQRQYYKMAAEAADKKAAAETDPEKKKVFQDEAQKFRHAPLEIKQIISKDLGSIDRCITCHVGMDPYTNPTMTNDFKDHPYKAHPKVDLV